MNIKIKEIYRKAVQTKYGERENITIIPEEDIVMDINGDPVPLTGRRISGFRDKNGETDKWVEGMTIKVQITTSKSIGKEGDEMEWVNFRLPEGVSSIVEQPKVQDPDDF